jgi:hypothetical protein
MAVERSCGADLALVGRFAQLSAQAKGGAGWHKTRWHKTGTEGLVPHKRGRPSLGAPWKALGISRQTTSAGAVQARNRPESCHDVTNESARVMRCALSAYRASRPRGQPVRDHMDYAVCALARAPPRGWGALMGRWTNFGSTTPSHSRRNFRKIIGCPAIQNF